jgi:hypothetical protein
MGRPTPLTKQLTLGRAMGMALVETRDQNARQTDVDQLTRIMLATRLYGEGPVELAPEEIALIKQSVPGLWIPLIGGQIMLALVTTDDMTPRMRAAIDAVTKIATDAEASMAAAAALAAAAAKLNGARTSAAPPAAG